MMHSQPYQPLKHVIILINDHMKNFFILCVIVGMGYVIYHFFTYSDVSNRETVTERIVRENDLIDLEQDLPQGSDDAIIEIQSDIKNFSSDIKEKINEWRISLNMWIEERI